MSKPEIKPRYILSTPRKGRVDGVTIYGVGGHDKFSGLATQVLAKLPDGSIALLTPDRYGSSILSCRRSTRELRSAYAKLSGIPAKTLEEILAAERREQVKRDSSARVRRLKHDAETLGYRVSKIER